MNKELCIGDLKEDLEEFLDARQSRIYLSLSRGNSGMSKQIKEAKKIVPEEFLPTFVSLINALTEEEISYTKSFYVQGVKDTFILIGRLHRKKMNSE